MFTFAQQSPAARRLIGLAVAATVAAGTAGSLAAADDAHAARCATVGSQYACGDDSTETYTFFHP